jgi:hypothetical protein
MMKVGLSRKIYPGRGASRLCGEQIALRGTRCQEKYVACRKMMEVHPKHQNEVLMAQGSRTLNLLARPWFSGYFPPAVAKVYIGAFVPMTTAGGQSSSSWLTICGPPSTWPGNIGGADFQSRFDKFTGQVKEMKRGALRLL